MKGHKRVDFRHNGERKRCESGWTWVCECGWSESCSTKKESLHEWRHHMRRVAEKKIILPTEHSPDDVRIE